MTADEAIEAYTERFGGFPYFLMMGATDEYLVRKVEEALATGQEISPEVPDAVY